MLVGEDVDKRKPYTLPLPVWTSPLSMEISIEGSQKHKKGQDPLQGLRVNIGERRVHINAYYSTMQNN